MVSAEDDDRRPVAADDAGDPEPQASPTGEIGGSGNADVSELSSMLIEIDRECGGGWFDVYLRLAKL